MTAHDVRRLKVCAGCEKPDLDLIKSSDDKHYHGKCLVRKAGLDLLAKLPLKERNKFTLADMEATGITLDDFLSLHAVELAQEGGGHGSADWLLVQLSVGKCMRRKGWPPFKYLTTTRRGRLTVHGEYDQKEQVALADLQASDWEKYEGAQARHDPRPARAGEAV